MPKPSITQVSKIIESEHRPWEENKGLTQREKHEILLRRYNGLVISIQKQNEFVDRMMGENTQLQQDVLQLNADLEAARASLQALGTKINDAGKHLEDEVMRLRELLKANDIPIGG